MKIGLLLEEYLNKCNTEIEKAISQVISDILQLTIDFSVNDIIQIFPDIIILLDFKRDYYVSSSQYIYYILDEPVISTTQNNLSLDITYNFYNIIKLKDHLVVKNISYIINLYPAM